MVAIITLTRTKNSEQTEEYALISLIGFAIMSV